MQYLAKIYRKGDKIETEKFDGEVVPVNTMVIEGYNVRVAVRMVIMNKDGKMAQSSALSGTYYKIPGGGVEKDEELIDAIHREALEEAGAHIEIESEIGAIIQYDHDAPFQISFCYLCNVVGELERVNLTDHEIMEQFELKWVSLKEAVDMLEAEKHDDVGKESIRVRELLILSTLAVKP